jgi:alkylhydroperoxidase family enzyme
MAPRVAPHEEPYEPRVKALLESMLPPDLPPLRVLRTFARNGPMARAMTNWMGYELSDAISVDLRARELVITRTCARCGCEYQWGLHVAVWAERAGLTAGQLRSIVYGSSADPCWTDRRDRLLLDLVDRLHECSDVDDGLWAALSEYFADEQMLDLLALCGWYHAVSFLVRGARVEREPGIPGFADLT